MRSILLVAVIALILVPASSAFNPPTTHDARSSRSRSTSSTSTTRQLTAVATSTNKSNSLDDLKSQILESIEPTKRGLSASAEQKSTMEAQIRALEAACPLTAPARDPRMGGGWEVLYTTAPPPSNGQLGPFVGVAKQEIDLDGGGYKNILQVGENNWLTAVLDASWVEWDGTLLVDKGGGEKWREAVVELDGDGGGGEGENDESSNLEAKEASSPFHGLMKMLGGQNKEKGGTETPDYGATSWKVDFQTITISLFGIPLFTQTFPDDTARVWKMTCEYMVIFVTCLYRYSNLLHARSFCSLPDLCSLILCVMYSLTLFAYPPLLKIWMTRLELYEQVEQERQRMM